MFLIFSKTKIFRQIGILFTITSFSVFVGSTVVQKWLFAKFGPIYGFGDLSCLPSSRVIIVNQGPGLVGSQMGVSQSELELAETER